MQITPLIASRFRSDGGAMFGLVPRPIWQRLLAPNADNAIAQNLNTALLRLADGRLGLLDVGCGNPLWFSARERAQHGLDERWHLIEGLARLGIEPDRIDFVVLTHLHWDHAGALGRIRADGEVDLTFPRARVYVHAVEWHDAVAGNPLHHKAYPREVWEPLTRLGEERLCLVHEDDVLILPGIRYLRSGGHTNGHATVLLEHDTLELVHPAAAALGPLSRIVYAGDVCPTHHHLRLVYQTAYDTFPLDTRRWKRTWLSHMAERGALLFFDHDPELFAARLEPDPRTEFRVTHTLEAP